LTGTSTGSSFLIVKRGRCKIPSMVKFTVKAIQLEELKKKELVISV
jgi:hypothetical protein